MYLKGDGVDLKQEAYLMSSPGKYKKSDRGPKLWSISLEIPRHNALPEIGSLLTTGDLRLSTGNGFMYFSG